MIEQPSLRERPRAETCPYCHATIEDGGDEAWACDRCGTRLHAECFEENRLVCTVLGCSGRAAKPPASGSPPDPADGEARHRARLERAAAREARRAAEQQEAARPVALEPWRLEPRGWFWEYRATQAETAINALGAALGCLGVLWAVTGALDLTRESTVWISLFASLVPAVIGTALFLWRGRDELPEPPPRPPRVVRRGLDGRVVYPWFQGPLGLIFIFIAPIAGLCFGAEVGGALGAALMIAGVVACVGTITLIATLGTNET